MAVFPAVLDACVLFNRPVTDTLLRSVEYEIYRVHWSQLIIEKFCEMFEVRPEKFITISESASCSENISGSD